MDKVVIIINGAGGVGKDTLCEMAARRFKVRNVSSITPIKKIAREYGGWNGEKDARARKFLADLKQLFVAYNDLPFKYLCEEYEKFMRSKDYILFMQIREGAEIEKVKNWIKTPCVTLLITRNQNGRALWGNSSDDNVSRYNYDYVYKNDNSLKATQAEFCKFLEKVLKESGRFEEHELRPWHKRIHFNIGKDVIGRYFTHFRKGVY